MVFFGEKGCIVHGRGSGASASQGDHATVRGSGQNLLRTDLIHDDSENAYDVLAFVDAFSDAAPLADFDQSGEVDSDDLIGFVEALEGSEP